MSSIKRDVKKKTFPTTGGEIVSRHPAHLGYASLRAAVAFHSHKIFPLSVTTRSGLGERQVTRVDLCQSGRRRRAVALASVRRSNCTCRFPAYSFHEDAREPKEEPREGIREIRFTKPNSSYSFTLGNCIQPRVRHRQNRCDQMRRTIQPSSLWKSVRTWARL